MTTGLDGAVSVCGPVFSMISSFPIVTILCDSLRFFASSRLCVRPVGSLSYYRRSATQKYMTSRSKMRASAKWSANSHGVVPGQKAARPDSEAEHVADKGIAKDSLRVHPPADLAKFTQPGVERLQFLTP